MEEKQLRENIQHLVILEKEIAKVLGNKVLDYVFLFPGAKRVDIQFPDLNSKTKTLLQNYIQTANEVISAWGVELETKPESLTENFLLLSNEIYYSRYVQAKMLYPYFSLTRILSPVEQQLLDNIPAADYPQQTFTINLPLGLVVDEAGNIDVAETTKLEKQEHNLAAELSSITKIDSLLENFLDDLDQISVKGVFVYFRSNELKEIIKDLLDECLFYNSKQIYDYLNHGLTLQNSKANVYAYLNKIINQPGDKFPEPLAELEVTINELLAGISTIPGITKSTATTLTSEIKELLLFYFKEGKFFAENFYSLKLRSGSDLFESEQKYDVVVDSYLVYDNGTITQFPVESYSLDHTLEAKAAIFEAVTNGLENPYFTLNDYLEV